MSAGKLVLFAVSFLLTVLPSAPAVAQQLAIEPDRDNTIYEPPPTRGEVDNSNGSGQYLFIGRILGAVSPTPRARRALIRFNLSAIPSEATVVAAHLELTISKAPPNTSDIDLAAHRLLVEFGEGSSDADAAGGDGANAVPPDATWLSRITSARSADTLWGAPGGSAGADYVALASSSTGQVAATSGAVTVPSSAGMVADVQGWHDGSLTNHGWILINRELADGSVRRFGSREHATPATRPKLVVTYEVPLFEDGFELGDTTAWSGTSP